MARYASILLTVTTLVAIVQNIAEAKSVIQEPSSVTERVVTNIDSVYNGAPLDYRYNESDSNSLGNPVSSPGCPKSDEGYPWVYYGSPPKCFLAGQQGPCEEDQSLFVKSDSPDGFCNCNCFEGGKVDSKKEQDQFCMGITKEFVFMPARGKCYTIYEQGPCKEDEWLVKMTNSSANGAAEFAHCEKRKCPVGEIPFGEDNNGNTNCGPPMKFLASPVSIPRNQCESDGMKYSELLQKCVLQFSFNIP
ncbi:unnamed protein product [Orchesella dallaii]|uniref:DUF4789 domain-containing protein n=1 Tax=Orchesella dallaii TaxID=48710 RepID=A0ABP1Q6N2_9HEXA